jgi:hypothetical protein
MQLSNNALLLRAAVWAVILAGFASKPLYAGGGPENFMLVVNSASPSSLAIANHYIALRRIPSSNVMYLEWKGDLHTTDIGTFRKQILLPILQTIESRGLTAHIDGILYSSDFPYSIDLKEDIKNLHPNHSGLLDKEVPDFATLNSVTYYYQLVLQQHPAYSVFQIQTNVYFRPVDTAGKQIAETHGFRSWYGWGQNGELLEVGGSRYLLSAILGITSGKGGNSVPEVVRYLERSAKADGSPPNGTVYLSETKDPRSTPRQPWFQPAVAELKKLAVAAEVITADVPVGKDDVAGGMFGAANVMWDQRNNTILPGAIVDDLTSYGGEIKNNTVNQTLLTEFLRAGAAGSSGTAVEPKSNPFKFPNPYLFVHYARGCNLVEAHYQAVAAPYQLVIVGDALCQPWAKIPTVQVEGAAAGDALKGTVTIRPSASGGASEVDRYELYLDGERIATCASGGQLELDTSGRSDGSHELRVVGICSGTIETQGRVILPVTFNNHGRKMTFTASADRIRLGQKIRLQAEAPGALEIYLYNNGRVLGKIKGDKGELAVNSAALGSGPITLRAIALGKGGASTHVLATPIELTIDAR